MYFVFWRSVLKLHIILSALSTFDKYTKFNWKVENDRCLIPNSRFECRCSWSSAAKLEAVLVTPAQWTECGVNSSLIISPVTDDIWHYIWLPNFALFAQLSICFPLVFNTFRQHAETSRYTTACGVVHIATSTAGAGDVMSRCSNVQVTWPREAAAVAALLLVPRLPTRLNTGRCCSWTVYKHRGAAAGSRDENVGPHDCSWSRRRSLPIRSFSWLNVPTIL